MNLHSTGASFVAAKEDNNPRDFVALIIKENPNATRKVQFDEFRKLLGENADEYQRAVDWYFFVNMHDYMTTNRSRPDPVRRAEAKAQQAKLVEKIKSDLMMLDLTMPNGKAMRDCTGAQMAKFSSAYAKLAKRVGSSKTVGNVLNEQQVRDLLK